MSEIRFYHLQTQRLEQALPALLSKSLSTGRRAVVRFADDKDIAHFNDHLWTYNPNSFLPHGSEKDGHSDRQPIYLTAAQENPNNAEILVLCGATDVPADLDSFSLCCDFLDGNNDEAVQQARARWMQYKDAGHTVTYWQQTENGVWEQKA
jgi:DNA polymerase-3 subunit chi